MEPRKPGSEKLPDFDSLDDRVIAKHTEQPIFVLKTNLDPEDSTVDNPYYKNKEQTDTKEFREFFEDKS